MIPKFIIIVPYRDRVQHKHFFERQIKHVLEDIPDNEYEIYFSHQCDKQSFNRGAIKNLGFLAMKDKYPKDYKNITFVFHDVDCIPYTKNLLNYETRRGVVKHFYGFEYALGGIVSINGTDFELMNGFPNYWNWGYEDNVLYSRALRQGLYIDRSRFFALFDNNILHFADKLHRTIDYTMKNKDDGRKVHNGLSTFTKREYTINQNMINITYFNFIPYSNNIKIMQINIRDHPDKIIQQKKLMNQKSVANIRKQGPPRNPVFRF